MAVLEERCNGCGRCLAPCEISGRQAIKVIDGLAVIDQKLCQKCNLCMLVCPEGAVKNVWTEGALPAVK